MRRNAALVLAEVVVKKERGASKMRETREMIDRGDGEMKEDGDDIEKRCEIKRKRSERRERR